MEKKTIKICVDYQIGDSVYLKTDTDQKERLVNGILIREGSIIYSVSCGASESWQYSFEMSSEKDILKTT